MNFTRQFLYSGTPCFWFQSLAAHQMRASWVLRNLTRFGRYYNKNPLKHSVFDVYFAARILSRFFLKERTYEFVKKFYFTSFFKYICLISWTWLQNASVSEESLALGFPLTLHLSLWQFVWIPLLWSKKLAIQLNTSSPFFNISLTVGSCIAEIWDLKLYTKDFLLINYTKKLAYSGRLEREGVVSNMNIG